MIQNTDGPLEWMNEYLEQHKNLAPDNWKGYRDLDMRQQAPPEFDNNLLGRTADIGTLDQDANPEGTDAGTEPMSAKTMD